MKITASKEIYVSTLWGTAITIQAGEIKELGDDLAYACLQAGCTEVKDTPPPPKPKKKKVSKTKKIKKSKT